jgi:hypothetical protein
MEVMEIGKFSIVRPNQYGNRWSELGGNQKSEVRFTHLVIDNPW